MNKRIISIIYELCRPQAEITISRLAEKYKVSPRTVRNDLNAISSLLQENRLNGLHLKSGGLVCREDDFEKILPFLSDRDFYTYKLSKEERVRVSAALLVNSQGYMTISAVADSLFVSRATVINDLDDVKKYIKAGSLSVFSHPNKGLRVDGLESDKRMFLMKQADRRDMAPGQVSMQAGNRIVIQKILNEQEHVHASYFTDVPSRKAFFTWVSWWTEIFRVNFWKQGKKQQWQVPDGTGYPAAYCAERPYQYDRR